MELKIPTARSYHVDLPTGENPVADDADASVIEGTPTPLVIQLTQDVEPFIKGRPP